MPSRILAAPLRLLQRLYRFKGQLVAPLDVELGLPVQFVHDISRQAELGTYTGRESGVDAIESPFFTINVDNVHAAGGELRQQIGIYSNQTTAWALGTWVPPDPDQETVWVLGAWGSIDVGGSPLTEAYIAHDFLPKAGAGSGVAPWGLIWTARGLTAAALTDGQNLLLRGLGSVADDPEVARMMVPTPFPISNKVNALPVLEFVSETSALATVDFFVQCIRLPVGVFPPRLR